MKKLLVSYITSKPFPDGMAEVNKMILTCKSINLSNVFEVIILLRYSNNKSENDLIKTEGTYDSVNYKFLTGISYRPTSCIVRNFYKFISRFNEISALKNTNIIIINSKSIIQILNYNILSKLLNFKIVNTYHELESSLTERSFLKKINDYFFEKFSPKIIHGALPISFFIENKIQKINPDIKSYVLPSLVDLKDFKNKPTINKYGNYFMYCGSASYFNAIKLIIDAYCKTSKVFQLLLVVNGDKNSMQKIKDLIVKKNLNEKVMLKSNISYNTLISLYKSSMCNLIPLSDTDRDKARFPHKIGEYCASSRPFITTKTPDILRYFTNNKNVFLSKNFDTISFSKLMEKVQQTNHKELNGIGLEAYKVAETKFAYKSHCKGIEKFIYSV